MIRMVIAEDQQMLLGALATLLDLEEGIEVVGKAGDGEELLRLARELEPDICMLDIEMPKKDGLDAARELKDFPCKVIILTTYARSGYFQRAKNAGVHGYLLKDSPSDDLAASIRKIHEGAKIYDPELIDLAFTDPSPLTEREKQVVTLMSEGKNTKAIADSLFITPATVRNYVSIILDKLGVTNRIEAIHYCQEKGWL
ncbi:DNA-binding response regulator [Salimicrobium jeotgali]|uniref:DNA-binding response regulator n=1 Tax=Salimicrobium jeotgali TaxID=1230341 RepID=K2GCQ6_9BACI|nr:response regulator transcription factor [Salimicrobium jeotgali]AKG03556.1 DNA-binding response regulator [Salimicrobium jeotgali]EKE32047.1 transcriptional regulatory protein uhpA [Salimicrobium jeotgali]MBM7696014.1 two-component system response regulator DesR [Salimicrobium jeotgali]